MPLIRQNNSVKFEDLLGYSEALVFYCSSSPVELCLLLVFMYYLLAAFEIFYSCSNISRNPP